jgi:hypothetical protein
MSRALRIKDFPDYYVTDTGDVYSRNVYKDLNGRIRKRTQYLGKDGYYHVGLYEPHKSKTFSVHRLVAQAFIPNPKKLPCVNHKDGNKQNNHISNLEWCTVSWNTAHSYRVLGNKHHALGKFGKDNPKSKIVLQILDNKIIAKHYGVCEASRNTGVHHTNICKAIKGVYKTAGGYQWKYKENKNENC